MKINDEMKKYKVRFIEESLEKTGDKKRLIIKQYYNYEQTEDLPRWEENGEAQVIINEDGKTIRISGMDDGDSWTYIYMNHSEFIDYIKRLKEIAKEIECE
jgi:hypothetical protein